MVQDAGQDDRYGTRGEFRRGIDRLDERIEESKKKLHEEMSESEKRLGEKISDVERRLGEKINALAKHTNTLAKEIHSLNATIKSIRDPQGPPQKPTL